MEQKFVRAPYKTGSYIAEVLEQKNDKSLLKITAVLKHPKQGDLHNPNQTDVPLFHERKALAEMEKVWVPKAMVKPYEEKVPTYHESLHLAYKEYEAELLEKNDDYSREALAALTNLKADYKFN
ncbi:sporulation phosphorelay system protein KapB [Alteribacillus sp. HJP-4]|uniref:sporulation phosphorelay system protein KapB n=1 Tax=Alteribacillus sp. HJP-4 TaxID=2775394 RepID=UPI0035CCFAED